MAAYLIVNTDIHDPAGYEEYRAGVVPLIRKHGGEFLARGGELQIFEGTWKPARIVLIRFPSMAAARAFMSDPEYQPVMAIRHRAAHTDLVAVDGV